jgi:hypothetical protein
MNDKRMDTRPTKPLSEGSALPLPPQRERERERERESERERGFAKKE